MERPRHSPVAIVNHWITVVLVTAMLVLGFLAAGAPDRAVARFVLGVHVSLGFFVVWFVLWRVWWRWREGLPAPVVGGAAERLLARAVHLLLLIVPLLLVVTGPLYIFSKGRCIDVFGWFQVCAGFWPQSKALAEVFETIHVIGGLYVLPVLLVLHLVGAIRHYFSPQTRG